MARRVASSGDAELLERLALGPGLPVCLDGVGDDAAGGLGERVERAARAGDDAREPSGGMDCRKEARRDVRQPANETRRQNNAQSASPGFSPL